jgi:PAS domain S-box-containing protein
MALKRLSHSVRQTYRKAPLQAVLILPFVFQTLIIVGLISYFSFRNERQTVDDLSKQLRQGITNRIKEKLKTYTETPHAINQLNAIAFANKSIDVDNAKGEEQFALQNKSFPFASVIYCASRSGATFGVGRFNGENSPLEFWITNATNHYIADYYSLNSQGKRVKVTRKDLEKYDPKQRPWYINAVKERKQNWTHVYPDFSKRIPTITASIPIYNSKNQSLLGICATDFFLSQETSKFLRSLELGKSGTAFIMERPDIKKNSGMLVSTSIQQPTSGSQSKPNQRVRAIDSENQTVKSTAKYLQSQFGNNFNQIKSSKLLDFRIDGKKQFVQVLPFSDKRGLDWLIVTVLPEADFMEQIQANTYITLILCIAALIIGVAISTLIARWITRPLVSLSSASKAIARGEYQLIEIERTGDLGELAVSFNWMAQQLQATFTEERRQAEEALQRSEAKFRRLFESNLIGAIVADLNGAVIEANDAFLNIIGYTQEDIQADRVNLVEITPSEYVQDDRQALKELRNNGVCSSYEKELRDKDDRCVPILIGYALLSEDQQRVIGFVLDLTQQKDAALAERIQREEALISEERNRIAGEIHDTLAQDFTGIKWYLESVEYLVADNSKAQAMINTARDLAVKGLQKARGAVIRIHLRELEKDGLSYTLQGWVNKTTVGTPLQAQCNIQSSLDFLPYDVAFNLFRVAQEAIINTIKHANASKVLIELTSDSQSVRLRVQDNGDGFNPDHHIHKGFGLGGMEKRVQNLGGRWFISSPVGQGTEVVATVPLAVPLPSSTTINK